MTFRKYSLTGLLFVILTTLVAQIGISQEPQQKKLWIPQRIMR